MGGFQEIGFLKVAGADKFDPIGVRLIVGDAKDHIGVYHPPICDFEPPRQPYDQPVLVGAM